MDVQLLPGERLDAINENLRLIQKTDGLTFGTDAYLLSAFLKPSSRARGAELGGGTGVLSLLALTRQKLVHTDVFEIQPEFAELCRRNAVLNNLAERMTVWEGDVRDIAGEQKLDVVYSNPPYMKADCGRNTDDIPCRMHHELSRIQQILEQELKDKPISDIIG